jgi:hypothetical protein
MSRCREVHEPDLRPVFFFTFLSEYGTTSVMIQNASGRVGPREQTWVPI